MTVAFFFSALPLFPLRLPLPDDGADEVDGAADEVGSTDGASDVDGWDVLPFPCPFFLLFPFRPVGAAVAVGAGDTDGGRDSFPFLPFLPFFPTFLDSDGALEVLGARLRLGSALGSTDGMVDGSTEGTSLGPIDGTLEIDGVPDGTALGNADGPTDADGIIEGNDDSFPFPFLFSLIPFCCSLRVSPFLFSSSPSKAFSEAPGTPRGGRVDVSPSLMRVRSALEAALQTIVRPPPTFRRRQTGASGQQSLSAIHASYRHDPPPPPVGGASVGGGVGKAGTGGIVGTGASVGNAGMGGIVGGTTTGASVGSAGMGGIVGGVGNGPPVCVGRIGAPVGATGARVPGISLGISEGKLVTNRNGG